MKTIRNIMATAALALGTCTPLMAQGVVEYFWDYDPGVGCGTVMQTFSGTTVSASAELDVSNLPTGIHTLGLRALNDTRWSATYHRTFYIPPSTEQITRIEYSWDNAAAPGKGTSISFTAGSNVSIDKTLSTKNLKPGMHTLYLRTLSTKHQSATYTRTFFVPPTSHAVEAVEYFFDNDPGVGNGTRMAATTTNDTLSMAFAIDTDGLSDGIHHVGLRTLTDGTWSATYVRQFLVRSQVDNYITRVEYYWDNDPGEGNGHTVDITPGEEVTADFDADLYMLDEGIHTLCIRAITGSHGSSTTQVKDIDFEGWDALQEYLNSLVDTEDSYDGQSYKRDYRNKNWMALYVPFAMSYNDWSAHFDVARINAFYQYDDDEDGVVDRQVLEAIMVKPGNGDLKPNHPYLIRTKTTGTYTFQVNPAKRVAQEINSISCSTTEARYTFIGNYDNMTGLKSAQRYRLCGGTLSIPDTDEEVLPPFRWYLTIDDLGNQLQAPANKIKLRIVGSDDTTGIDDAILADDDECVGPRKVYDLQGRRVQTSPDTPLNSLPHGIYIIDNKKWVVK